ncbi:unnamed protein product [Rotaria sp. Silwood2]|nr:unnamed protein product [Rotaria sp. Silwood2]CAF2753932.1 unnamed protein product [Rotaria sp. Silwood2]CAF4065926.1 unnamed protein product [Rotaria sp. Silwood2]CAF4471626.1 unnamed protein product [Rotaria sp. Silwood2]
MERVGVDICGLAEIRWEGQGHFNTTKGHTVIYSGNEKRGQHGVAIWIHRKIAKAIISYEPVNERMMVVRLNARPKNITLVQVYAPTTTAEEEVTATFYEELERASKKIPKNDIMMMMGDFNAKVGKQNVIGPAVGPFGLGEANDAGDRFREFCEEHELILVNTWFKKHPRRLYTWKSPDGKSRNQIDYITINQKWKTSVMDCTTYPGADCDTDHHLLVATTRIRLRKIRKKNETPKLNVEKLKEEKATAFAITVTNRFTTLGEIEEDTTPDLLWKTVKTVLMETARDIVGYKKQEKHKSWISAQTMEMIKEQREMKQKDPTKYKKLKAEVQKKLRQDKQNQLNELCNELEMENKKGNTKKLFQTAKKITRKFHPRLNCIKSKTGENITETEKIAERWKEYCQELYEEKDNTINWNFQIDEQEPPPLISEVERAIKDTASQKTPGPDDVPVELIKNGGESTIKLMHQICVTIWKTGKWPEDWTDSLFIPLPKKGDSKQCSNYRTIALVSHASKIILRIILERIRMKTEEEIAIEQAGFRRGRGTRDQVVNLRLLLEKTHEHQQTVFMCFIDFKKAFDSISHNKLWTTMMKMGYPPHLIHLLAELYQKQNAKVKVAGTVSESFHIKKGVRQGCVISPYLFNIIAEMAMRETLEDFTGGIQIGGQEITNLRYADDIVLTTQSMNKLQELPRTDVKVGPSEKKTKIA